jgi:hypothetical protein
MEYIMISWLPLLLLAALYALIVSLEWRKGRRLEQTMESMKSSIDTKTASEGELSS